MTNYGNKGKDTFLKSICAKSLDDDDDLITIKCKFNLSYFTIQAAGQDFKDWPENNLVKLLESLRAYSEFSLAHWQKQPIGKSGTVLAIYGKFPSPSDFTRPTHIPHQAMWGRFRLTSGIRLVGFTIPKEFDGKLHSITKQPFDCNTFYVVFLDMNHVFWKTGESK